MKDEIKEIINDLQRVADRKCYPEDILCGSIAQEWVDYITNLQEEIKRQEKAQVILDNQNAELYNKLTNLQERCDYLERSNNRREDEIISLRDECVDGETYKLRCEKALDKLYCYGEVFDKKILQQFQKEMENILQGEDNGNK